ncbi:unnamed protein product [Ixodes pacificus]
MRCVPLPKNMNSEHNLGRRIARAKAFDKLHSGKEHVFHADAGPYPGEPGRYLIAVHDSQRDTVATIKATDIDEAEKAVVALARIQAELQGVKIATITTETRTALFNMSRGRIGQAAHLMYKRRPASYDATHTLTWVPAHSGHTGNEMAHSVVVRALHHRATRESGLLTINGDHSYGASPYTRGPVTYGGLLRGLRLRRKTLAGPHKGLSRQQKTIWRKLQLRNTPTPHILKRTWPDLFSGRCGECGSGDGSWRHTYWECPGDLLPAALRELRPEQDEGPPVWKTILAAEDLDTQLAAIARAQEIEDRLRTRLRHRRVNPPILSIP